MSFIMNCEFDCPQFVRFDAEEFFASNSVQGGTLTASVVEHKLSKDASMTEDSLELEENSRNPLTKMLSRDHSLVTETSPYSVTESCILEDISVESLSPAASSVSQFPVHKPIHSKASRPGLKKSVTKVQEFHLTECKKQKTDNYVPLAEQVHNFQTKTPKRLRATGPKEYQPGEHWNPPLVVPKSPELRAVKRRRGTTAISRAEQEEKEYEEIKKYQFHARPLNAKVLADPHLPKKQVMPPTKPEEFQLKTTQRAAIHYANRKEEPKFEFHANPVPKAILSGATGLKEKEHIPLTVPKSPAFALKNRIRKWNSFSKRKSSLSASLKFRARCPPSFNSPFVVKHENKAVLPQPFSFDQRDKERFSLKKQKIKEVIEKENTVPTFKAQALPSFEPRLPCVPKKPLTQVEPFNFIMANKSDRTKLDTTMTLDTTFRARPATVLKKPPFVPEKSHKELPEVQEFHLRTEDRAKEWQKTKELNEILEKEKELIRLQQKAEEEEKERRELAMLRKETVHKANPVRVYSTVEIKPSSKPLTIPQSPKFASTKRIDNLS